MRQVAYEALRLAGVRSIRTKVRGRPLWIPVQDRTLGRYFSVLRTYGPFEADLLERAARPGSCAIDLGANVASLTVLLAHKVGSQGRVVSFAPEPFNYCLLQRNVETTGLSNVICEQAAVTEREGPVSLYLST